MDVGRGQSQTDLNATAIEMSPLPTKTAPLMAGSPISHRLARAAHYVRSVNRPLAQSSGRVMAQVRCPMRLLGNRKRPALVPAFSIGSHGRKSRSQVHSGWLIAI